MKILSCINKIFLKLQRRVQGMPSGSAHLYDKLATRILEPLYDMVTEEYRMKTREDLKILEVGCGAGKLLGKVADKFNTYTILGLDISEAMVMISKKNLDKHYKYKVDLFVADAHRIPLKRESIDLILSTGTLHHIRRPCIFFQQCIETLSEYGEAWIYEFSCDAPDKELKVSAELLRKPSLFLKIVASLHGIPRREYNEGYIKQALDKAKAKYEVKYEGIITKLILKT